MPLAASNDIQRNYVPGRGRIPARVLICGEAPGEKENASGAHGPGWPFIGQAGQELDRYMAWGASLFRQDVYVTNLVKYWPLCDWKGKQLPPTAEQIAAGEPELLAEIALVHPEIIVAVGAHAARYFLGEHFQSLRRDGGVPRLLSSGIVCLPVTHPAAGLHNDREQVNIQRDFEQLGRLLRGEIQPRGLVSNQPVRKRRRIYDDRMYCGDCSNDLSNVAFCCGADELTGAELVARVLAGRTQIAIDTEGGIDDPWCLTFCVEPNEGWLLRSTERECIAALNAHINAPSAICTCIFHYLAHDIPVCEPHPTIRALRGLGVIVNKHRALNADGTLTLRDTMSEYFLLGTEPKGLKPLGWRELEVDMRSYEELVGPTEQEVSSGYVLGVFEQLRCAVCSGTGKLPKYGTEWIPAGDCAICFGGGFVLLGKKGQPLKNPKRCQCCIQQERVLKTADKCAACTDGLLMPLADREFIFDAKKSEWRWKQPQSIGKWIRRRLGHAEEEDSGGDSERDQIGSTDSPSAEAAEDEPAHQYFKLRRDWQELEGRADWEYVNAVVGRMPRTTLTEVEQREGEQAVTDYACDDAIVTFGIAQKVEPRLAALGLLPIREQDAAFIPMLSRMEQIGMRIDRAHFQRLDAHLNARLDAIRESLSTLIGKRMNPNSPVMADVLFRELGLPSIKFTASGARESIDDDVLGALKAQLRRKLAANPSDERSAFALSVVEHVTDYREVRKITDYTRPILQYSDRQDRIHTTLNYSSVATGRLSSSEPINLQTLPNPDNYPDSCPAELNYGTQVRSGFIARPGYKLISADYSQIEMVVGAHLTQDAGMLRVFRDGLDLHYYAAALMFGIAYDQVPKTLRTMCKPLNFGAFYGLSAIGLQAQFASFPAGAIEKSERECQDLIDKYYAAFPGVLQWKEQLWEDAESTGYVRDLFGRIRWVPGLRSRIRKVRAAAEREAANMPVQSTANGIIRIGSRRLWEDTLPKFWEMGIDAEVIMQTHDENIAESPEEWAPLVSSVMADVMRSAVTLSVPIKVGIKIGNNLAECH